MVYYRKVIKTSQLILFGGGILKKLVLVLVSAVILMVFMSLNYLLWDREKSLKSFQDKDLSYKTDNEQLKNRVEELESENTKIKSEFTQIKHDKENMDKSLIQSSDTVNRLARHFDLKPLEELVNKWVESMNSGQLESAYSILDVRSFSKPGGVSQDEFNKTYQSISSIKLKSIEPCLEGGPNDKKGYIVFKASLEVAKAEGSTVAYLNNGINEVYFLLAFDAQKNQWVIADISTSL